MGRRIGVGQAIDGEVRLIKNKSRQFVTYVVVGLGSALILGAAIKGVVAGDFSALGIIWAVVGPVYGAIGGHYFRTTREKS